jgi:hypothetical protein
VTKVLAHLVVRVEAANRGCKSAISAALFKPGRKPPAEEEGFRRVPMLHLSSCERVAFGPTVAFASQLYRRAATVIVEM